MKRIFSQITDAVWSEKTEQQRTNAIIRMTNSMAAQMIKSGAVEPKIEEITDPVDDTTSATITMDAVIMTVDEARFLFNHCQGVQSENLELALKLQEIAKREIFVPFDQIPREEMPKDENGRSILDRRDADI